VGAKLLHAAFVRLLGIALVVVSASCGTVREPEVASPAESVIAAWVMLPAKELYGPVAGEGALWLRDVETGVVFRVDPEKNALVAQIDVGRGCCLAVGEDAVWATGADTSQLLRIDPISNGLTARIRVGVFPEGLAVAFGSVWVSNRRSGTVSRVDPTTNQVIATVNVSREGAGGPNAVGRGGDSLWVGVSNRGEVLRIDPTTNKVSGVLTLPGAGCHDLATSGATLWLAGGCIHAVVPRKVWKVDTQRMKIAATIEPGGDIGTPALWRGQLWMLTGLHLVSIDQKTNRVVERAAIQGPGNAAVADGTLWVSNPSKLLRLRLG
jgi:YVTN family beta-propeller protein